MQARDGSDQRQAEAVARAFASAVAAVKTQHDIVALLGRDAAAGIGDDDRGARAQRDRHRPPRGRELDRVVDQIADRLEQQVHIAVEPVAPVSRARVE